MAYQVVHSPDNDVAANTEIDISDQLPEAMDIRNGNDPIVHASLKSGADDTSNAGTTVLDTTALASQGEVAAGDPAAGEIGFVSATSIALGDALDNNSILQLEVELRNSSRQVL